MYTTPNELGYALGRGVKIVSRQKWKAKEPRKREELIDTPVRYMVVIFTMTPPCKSRRECIKVVQDLQEQHMAEGEPDIRYNYLISVDGTVYEGRGPKTVPACFPETDREFFETNRNSINVAFIDDGSAGGPVQVVEAASLLATQLYRDQVVDAKMKLMWYLPKKKEKKRGKRHHMTGEEFKSALQMKRVGWLQKELKKSNKSVFDVKPLSTVKKYFCRVFGYFFESCSD